MNQLPPPPRIPWRIPEKKNVLTFRICARPISSKRKGHFSFLRSALLFGQADLNADRSFGKTIFWGKDLPKTFGRFVFDLRCRKMEKEGLGRIFHLSTDFFLANFPVAYQTTFSHFLGAIDVFAFAIIVFFFSNSQKVRENVV